MGQHEAIEPETVQEEIPAVEVEETEQDGSAGDSGAGTDDNANPASPE